MKTPKYSARCLKESLFYVITIKMIQLTNFLCIVKVWKGHLITMSGWFYCPWFNLVEGTVYDLFDNMSY